MEKVSKYKSYVILARQLNDNYQIGIQKEIPSINKSSIPIWLERAKYNSIDEAKISGREYARMFINKLSN